MAVVEATGLSKRYGRKPAVDDLSFEVQPGRVTGFLGPNGAGKSTTIRLMLQLDRGQGRTTFDGRTFRELRQPMREVGTVLEAKPFHATRRARNHLRMLAAGSGIHKRRVDEVLDLVGLPSVAKGKPKGFSLGMSQRLGLAAALLGEPHTLVLDEPANGLDPQGVHWLRGFLKSYAAEGRSVFVSSHLLAEMALLADDVVVIGRGQLLARKSVADFVARAAQTTVVVRSPQADRLTSLLEKEGATVVREDGGALSVTGAGREEIGEIAFTYGVVLHELATRTASLEEAFLEATSDAQEFRGAQPDAPQPPAPQPAVSREGAS